MKDDFMCLSVTHDPMCETCYPARCPVRSSITEQPCLLPDGHPMWSAVRFHRYAKPPEPQPLEHIQSRDCWCVPKVEVYEHGDLVIHNSKEDGN